MRSVSTAAAALLLPVAVFSVSTGRPGYGLIGYGIDMYQPTCAYACKDSISNPLNCDDRDMRVVRRMGGMSMEKPSPECYATNDPYLQSLAYCISTHCANVDMWKLERFWLMNVAGRKLRQPMPKMPYQEALESIDQVPTKVVPSDEMLHNATLVDEETYLSNYNGNHGFEMNEGTNSRYSLVLILTCAILPIALSCLRCLPIPGPIVSRFSATFIDPPLFGSRHEVPFFNTAHMPTRGQGLFIGYLLAINIILSAAGYKVTSPNSWYETRENQIANYIANRTGALSAANLSLLVLFAGRNNFLLWLTNWSHSTFLLMHRWIAAICTIQACLHSAMYLQSYIEVLKDFGSVSKLDYWTWGVVSTITMVALLPASMYYLRKRFYELFLVFHILLAFFAIIGYYYHIYLRFGRQWGYELWAYIAFAIWAFDRVTRVLRLSRNGVKNARVTVVDQDYVRLDVPGVSATGQAYLYFPTLTWRVWENHPFSVAGSLLRDTASHHHQHHATANTNEKVPTQSKTAVGSDSDSNASIQHPCTECRSITLGLTFFVRTHTGLTQHLRTRKTVPVLVESSYGHSLLHDQHAELDTSPDLVCIAGGVGITAILPLLAKHAGMRKLYWGLRNRGLEEAVRDIFDSHGLVGVQRHVSVGQRLDVRSILEREIGSAEATGSKIAVVVSGPAGMADEVRTTVARLASRSKNAEVTLIEECYSW